MRFRSLIPLALAAMVGPLAQGAQAAGLTLEAAIEQALRTHPDAQSAESRLTEAKLAVDDAAMARYQLTTDLTAQGRTAQGGIGQSPMPARSDQGALNGNLTLTVPLFTGWKLSSGLEAAEKSRDASQARYEVARSELEYQVTQAFWGLRRAELAEEIQAEAVQQNERTLKLTKTAVALGNKAASEFDQAEVNWLNAQGERLRLQGATQEARLVLARLLGVEPAKLTIDPAPAETAPSAPLPDETQLEAWVEARGEVRAAKAQLEAAQASVAAARADQWPTLALVGSLQYGNNAYDPILGARSSAVTFSGNADGRVVLSYSGFDNGKIARAIARAQEAERQAELSLELARREVRQQIALALVHARNARTRLQMAERSTGIAGRTLNWIQARYEQGYSPQVEVNQAINSLVSARSQQVAARMDDLLARAELRRALAREELSRRLATP